MANFVISKTIGYFQVETSNVVVYITCQCECTVIYSIAGLIGLKNVCCSDFQIKFVFKKPHIRSHIKSLI